MNARQPERTRLDGSRARQRLSWVALTACIVLVAAACSSSSSEELDISFTTKWYSATNVEEWVATGPAVEAGVLCAAATTTSGRFEYPDGSELTMAELGRLNDGTEPFSYVAIAERVCDDGSGSFTIRARTDATNPAAFEQTGEWELEGGPGYEGVAGEGPIGDPVIEGDPVVLTTTSGGVVRRP